LLAGTNPTRERGAHKTHSLTRRVTVLASCARRYSSMNDANRNVYATMFTPRSASRHIDADTLG